MVTKKRLISIICVLVLPMPGTTIAAENITRMLHCHCISNYSLCQNASVQSRVGELFDWHQEITYAKGALPTTEEMRLACWRKRDSDPFGSGNCCSFNGNEKDASRYFMGKLN